MAAKRNQLDLAASRGETWPVKHEQARKRASCHRDPRFGLQARVRLSLDIRQPQVTTTAPLLPQSPRRRSVLCSTQAASSRVVLGATKRAAEAHRRSQAKSMGPKPRVHDSLACRLPRLTQPAACRASCAATSSSSSNNNNSNNSSSNCNRRTTLPATHLPAGRASSRVRNRRQEARWLAGGASGLQPGKSAAQPRLPAPA